MEIIVKANENRLKEGKRDMCNALLELMKDELDEKKRRRDKRGHKRRGISWRKLKYTL